MYPIIEVPEYAEKATESLGTKRKFWYSDKSRLFKASTPRTGEHWGEKAACELCALLGLPHAHYELAAWKGLPGVVSANIVPPKGRLVLGNELLAKVTPDYPAKTTRGVVEHNLQRIHALMEHAAPAWSLPPDWQAVPGIAKPFELFVGYLLLDAWIANQDRHHENWGVIVTGNKQIYLAPTFDHAACLGQNESDEKRRRRLDTRDKNYHIEHYVTKAISAFYDTPAVPSNKPLNTVDAFSKASALCPEAGRAWLAALARISPEQYQEIFTRLPPACGISGTAVKFAVTMLKLNHARLLILRG
ncbi:MAG: phosphatidylinositol kinase [Gammaproteobacteria bacterium]|nr:phosphatidylinositol kinase [Gammaproteobacteria bacterium]